MSENNINKEFVLALKEDETRKVSITEHLIESSEIIETELNAIVENPNKTLWDIFSTANKYLDYKKEPYNLCHPYEYNASYINAAYCPKEVDYDEYKSKKENFIEILKKQISQNWEETETGISDTELKEKITDYEKKLKRQFAKSAIRYIKCQRLEHALSQVKNDPSTKMYSTDTIGWSTFKHQSSADIEVIVKTNFCYGNSAYFYLLIKYKDILIVPYSDLVHYYYADMKHLISYTRYYTCKRSSWRAAMEFVEGFVNGTIENPEKYLRNFVLSEIEEMMKVLRKTIINPSEILDKIKYNKPDYISMNVIRPFNLTDKGLFKVIPKELTSVFKAEKISGALLFIEGFKKIESLCPELTPVMQELREMNLGIKSEVDDTLISIKQSIAAMIIEKEQVIKQFEDLKTELPFEVKDVYIGEEITERDRIINSNQYYKTIARKLNELRMKRRTLERDIHARRTLENRMKKCLTRINSLDEQ